MKRWWIWMLLIGLIVAALAGCGGGDKKDKNGDQPDQTDGPGAVTPSQATVTPRGPTPTPRDPSPRSEALPVGDPYAFEAPFSAGNFVRQTMRGNATSARTGGLQATYQLDQDVIAVTVYRFEQPQEAVDTVQFVLEGSSVTGTVETPYYGPTVAYGVVQVRSGAYMAAWSHYEWVFIAQTSTSLDALNAFLQVFPY
jgi:hypothetical protein